MDDRGSVLSAVRRRDVQCGWGDVRPRASQPRPPLRLRQRWFWEAVHTRASTPELGLISFRG